MRRSRPVIEGEETDDQRIHVLAAEVAVMIFPYLAASEGIERSRELGARIARVAKKRFSPEESLLKKDT